MTFWNAWRVRRRIRRGGSVQVRPGLMLGSGIEGLEHRTLLAVGPPTQQPPVNPGSGPTIEVKPIARPITETVGWAVDMGETYYASNSNLPIYRRVDQFAVRPAFGYERAAIDAMIAPGRPLAGYTADLSFDNGSVILVRTVKDGGQANALTQYERLQQDMVIAKNTAGIGVVEPVFHQPQYNARMVASNEVIVDLKYGVTPESFFWMHPEFSGYRHLQGSVDQYVATLSSGSGAATVALAAQLTKSNGSVDWVEPNFYQDWKKYFTPNDPIFTQQWHLNNTGQNFSRPNSDSDLPEAWDIVPGGSPSVVISVVDDGMEFTHPDLLPNLFINTGEIAGNSLDDDGNGWVDDVNGWDFTSTGSGDNDPGPTSTGDAHATSVAGIAAGAGNNSLGIAGAAYRSKIMPVRIFDGATATSTANIASAVNYAGGRRANGTGPWTDVGAMNNSWGGGAPATAITDAFTWTSTNGRSGRGVLVSISSGNSGAAAMSYPASLAATLTGVMGIGASTDINRRASYSQYDVNLDVVTPSSGGIFGTVTTDRQGANGYNAAAGVGGDYTTTALSAFGGTSSASPLNAGIAALVLARDNTLTSATVKQLLRGTADKIGGVQYDASGRNLFYGSGKVNAFTAVTGVGVRRAQVLDNNLVIASGAGVASFSATLGSSQTKTLVVRNTGTLALNLGAVTLGAGAGFSLVSGLTSTSLSVGQAASFVVRFDAAAAGISNQTLTFTTNDPSTPTYTITLRGQSVIPSISGGVFEDRNGNSIRDVADAGLANWVVYLDTNSNGSLDRTVSTPNYTGAAVAIPDLGRATIPLNVSGLTGRLTDVDVRLTINHTYNDDVIVFLISPSGVRSLLWSNVGSFGQNFTSTVLDDQAATSIEAGAAPFTGSFRPSEALSIFNGGPANGTWTLEVFDNFSGDVGTVTAFGLTLITEIDTTAITDSSGNYTFNDLAVGTYTVRAENRAGYSLVVPVGGFYTVPVASVASTNPNRDFALIRTNAVYGRVTEDWDNDGVIDPNDPGLANWTTYIDLNNNGALDQATTPVASGTINLSLPDQATATSNLSVSGISGTILDLNVTLNITHTWDGDLIISLISPAGTTVALVTNRGGSGDNFTNTVLDDQAATAISAGTAPFTGSFRPEGLLSTVNGQNPNGTWSLRIQDTAAGDVGTLINWTLSFVTVVEPTGISDATGNYVVAGTVAGANVVRQVVQAGWLTLSPASGFYTYTLAANQTAFNANFGRHRANSIYARKVHDLNANGTREETDTGLAGWNLFVDGNNNGTRDTSTVSRPTGAVNVALLDNITVDSPFVVSGLAGTIVDLNVTLNITHTWDGDLVISLISPAGTTVALVTNRGGSGDNFTNTVLDDQATTAISAGTAPFTGSFRPEAPLSGVNGQNPNGTWIVRIRDTASGDTGTLLNWTLTFGLTEPLSVTDALGNARFDNMSAGTYAIREESQTGWSRTFPASGVQSRTLTTGASAWNADFGGLPSTSTPSVTVGPIMPNPRQNPVLSAPVTFSQLVSGFDLADLRLTRNGSPVSLAGTTISTTDNVTYTVNMPAALTTPDGNYVLTVVAAGSGIVNIINNPLPSDGSVSFTVDNTAPTVGINPITPNPRNTAVTTATVVFSEAVTGFDAADLSMTRGGSPVSLAGASVATTDNITFTVTLPAAASSVTGSYVLSLLAAGSGVTDVAGNALGANATQSFAVDLVPPTASIDPVTPDPRRTPVSSITVRFSEIVSGVGLADFQLLRDGSNVPLTGATVTTSDNLVFTVGNLTGLTSAEGSYVFTVIGGLGITDPAGNGLASSVSDNFAIDLTGPVGTVQPITPNPRNTPVTSVNVLFNELAFGVDLSDFAMSRGATPIPLVGASLSTSDNLLYTLTIPAALSLVEGGYTIAILGSAGGITDALGNVSIQDSSFSFAIDYTAPSVGINPITPNPRNVAVTLIGIQFNEPVLGVDPTDFSLIRNGVTVPLTGATVSTSNGALWTLILPAPLTAPQGNYSILLNASGAGITDIATNPLPTGSSATFVVDTTAPTVIITQVTPDPRYIGLGTMTITFTEPVNGFNLADLRLTRDGGPNLLTAAQTLTTSDNRIFTLNNLLPLTNFVTGTYTLTLTAAGSGITDIATNPLTSNASETYVVDLTVPKVLDVSVGWGTSGRVSIFPNVNRVVPFLSVNRVFIRFSKSVSVDLADVRLTGKTLNYTNGGSVSFDPATYIATVTLGRTISVADRLELRLDGSSPNGINDGFRFLENGVFNFSTGALTGDFDGDGIVTIVDANLVRNNIPSVGLVSTYVVWADINGDGVVSYLDHDAVRNRIGNRLP